MKRINDVCILFKDVNSNLDRRVCLCALGRLVCARQKCKAAWAVQILRKKENIEVSRGSTRSHPARAEVTKKPRLCQLHAIY